jgi:hypothetical protein
VKQKAAGLDGFLRWREGAPRASARPMAPELRAELNALAVALLEEL